MSQQEDPAPKVNPILVKSTRFVVTNDKKPKICVGTAFALRAAMICGSIMLLQAFACLGVSVFMLYRAVESENQKYFSFVGVLLTMSIVFIGLSCHCFSSMKSVLEKQDRNLKKKNGKVFTAKIYTGP